jgi:hypothetical protein
MVLFGIGGNPLQIQIEIQPNQNSLQSKSIVPLDHSPNWRVSKNVFMSSLSKQTLQNVIRKNNTAMMQVHPHQPVVAEPQFGGMSPQPLQPIIYAHSETEDVQGVVHLMLQPGKHFEHAGIKIQFVGRIEMVRRFSAGMCVTHSSIHPSIHPSIRVSCHYCLSFHLSFVHSKTYISFLFYILSHLIIPNKH